MARSIMATATTSTPCPAGVHNARIYRITDLGTQTGEYNGKPKKDLMIQVSFECVDTRHAFDKNKPNEKKPFTVHKFYTYKMSPKSNLQIMYENVRGVKVKPGQSVKIFDDLLDQPCQIQVYHEEKDGKTNAKIKDVFAPNPKVKVKPAYNDIEVLDLDHFDKDVFLKLSQGIQEMIKKSPEFQENVLMTGSLAEDPEEQRAKKGGAGKKPAAKKAKK